VVAEGAVLGVVWRLGHGGRRVSLAQHCASVELLSRQYATELGLDDSIVDDIALAGWLHDIGKADPRFQLMLREGSRLDLIKDPTPLAKSRMPAGASAAHRQALDRSRFPIGARHDLLSLAMIEQNDVLDSRAHDVDLVLYLVASHHGLCRPFAPVITDDSPVDVALARHHSDRFGTVDFGGVSSRGLQFRHEDPFAQRIWALVESFGRLGVCLVATMLRLADHRVSEMEATAGHGPA
jgi:CRISPR-associated endonuclease/helicase Cas3